MTNRQFWNERLDEEEKTLPYNIKPADILVVFENKFVPLMRTALQEALLSLPQDSEISSDDFYDYLETWLDQERLLA